VALMTESSAPSGPTPLREVFQQHLTNQATNHPTKQVNLQSVSNTVGKIQDIIMSHSE